MHMVHEIGEAISLVFSIIGYVIILRHYMKHRDIFLIFVAYNLLFIGTLATVLEAYFLAETMNLLEHSLGSAMAGIAFALVAYKSNQKNVQIQNYTRSKMRSRK